MLSMLHSKTKREKSHETVIELLLQCSLRVRSFLENHRAGRIPGSRPEQSTVDGDGLPSHAKNAVQVTAGLFGVSLSKPHTRVTALQKCVCIRTYVLVCLRSYTVNFK